MRALLLPVLLSLAAPAQAFALPAPVALVLVDEASEKSLGWPLPPAALLEALDKIEAAKPLAVVLKFFADPALDQPPVAEAFQKHGNVYLQCAGADAGDKPDAVLLSRSLVPGAVKADFDDRPSVNFPPKALARASAGVGFVHVKLNPATGAAERWQLVSMAGGQKYASLPLLLAARKVGLKPKQLSLKAKGGGWLLSAGGLSWQLDHEGALPIAFTEPGKGHPRYSLLDAKAGKLPLEALAGKVVVIGPDLPSRAENGMKTPKAKAHSKVELFADAVATLLR